MGTRVRSVVLVSDVVNGPLYKVMLIPYKLDNNDYIFYGGKITVNVSEENCIQKLLFGGKYSWQLGYNTNIFKYTRIRIRCMFSVFGSLLICIFFPLRTQKFISISVFHLSSKHKGAMMFIKNENIFVVSWLIFFLFPRFLLSLPSDSI